jgi:maleylacetate reductase
MSLMAEEGIRALAEGMKKIHVDATDIDARADCLYGAWLCGTVLGNVGMALHHKLCHTLGGSFNLPHAQTHTIVLPHAIAYNQCAAPALSRISRALDVGDCSPASALFDLSSSLGAPTRLKDLGLTEADLDRATDIAMSNPYWNPRPIEASAIRQLLQDAYEGARPR